MLLGSLQRDFSELLLVHFWLAIIFITVITTIFNKTTVGNTVFMGCDLGWLCRHWGHCWVWSCRYEWQIWVTPSTDRWRFRVSCQLLFSEWKHTVVLGASQLNSEGYKPLQDHSKKGKRKPSQTDPYSTILEIPLPTRSSCPKTVFSPSAEQFHLPYRNWYWHSLIPICAPSPITMMASGRLWQIARCRGARPGILLQIMLAPKATTDDKALKKKAERHVITKLRWPGAAVWLARCCCKRGRVGGWVPVIMPIWHNVSGLV